MTRNRVIILLIVIAVGAAIYYQISLNRRIGSDEEQIAAIIRRGESGVERKDFRMAMSIVSRNYKDSVGTTYPILRIRAADALNSPVEPDVILADNRIAADGDHGSLQTHLRVVDRRGDETIFEHDLTIHLRKENLRKYLIFRTREWRVVSVDGLESLADM